MIKINKFNENSRYDRKVGTTISKIPYTVDLDIIRKFDRLSRYGKSTTISKIGTTRRSNETIEKEIEYIKGNDSKRWWSCRNIF